MIARAMIYLLVVLAAASVDRVAAAQDAQDVQDAQDEGSALLVRVFGGVGLGTRDFSWESPGELRTVESGPFAALEVGASIAFAWSDSFSLGPAFAYQTSFAHEVEEAHLAGQPDVLSIRAHRFDAVLAATLALGSAGFRLSLGVGVGVQNLRPEVHHLLTPTYSLAGPLGRLVVRIPFTRSFALRLAPEVQWVIPSDTLEEHGIDAGGFLVGGEVALELALTTTLMLELAARDARAWLPSNFGGDATDTGMFATTRLVWQP